MRRVVLFLLIFGAGFAVLWSLRSKPGPEDRRAEPTAPRPPGEFTDVSAPSPKKEGQTVAIRFDGELSFTQHKDVGGVRQPQIELTSSDVDPVGEDVYDMHDLRVQLYDPTTQKKRAELESPLSRVQLTLVSGTPRLSETDPVRMTNVDLALHEGGPIVPLHLKVPALDWVIGDETFASDDRVRISGTGLQADGSGLMAKLRESSLELLRDAKIEFTLENGQLVRLFSGPTGPITVRKLVKDGVDLLDVTASEGARFEIEGAEPVTINAQTIHMLGRKAGDGGTGYVIDSADARGAVSATSRGDTFRSQVAVFRFASGARLTSATLDGDVVLVGGPDTFHAEHAEFEFEGADTSAESNERNKNRLVKATLTGSPSGTIQIGRFLPPDRRDLPVQQGNLSGQGPLVITRKAVDEVDFAGPAKLELPEIGLVLTARERIAGHDDPAAKKGQLTARGSGVLVYGQNKVESDVLELKWTTDEGGITTAGASTQGVTTVKGVSDLGQAFTILARGGLEATAAKDKVIVDVARDVVITPPEPGGLAARADVVRNIDWDARRFEAQGNVTFSNAQGQGSADRVVSVSRTEARAYGTPGTPARYAFARSRDGRAGDIDAEVEAEEIALFPDHVDARGAVHARVESGGSKLELDGATLELEVTPEDPLAPDAPRVFHAHAAQDVKGRLVRAGETADVTCEDLVVDGLVKIDPSAVGQSVVTTTNITARSRVHIDYKGQGELTGDGDLFTLDGKGLGRLSADAGKKVRAHGRFVGTPLPYDLEADRVEFDAEHVEAWNVRVRLDDKGQPVDAAAPSGGPPSSAQPAAPLPGQQPAQVPGQEPASAGPGAEPAVLGELRADNIRADKKEIRMSGSAHVEGVTRQGEAWTIDADSVRMLGDFSEARALQTDKITLLEASGGFHAALGERLEAHGEKLDATPRRIRVEGAPAHMVLLDAEWQSPWIEYDMANMLLSTDTGSLRSRIGSPGPSWSIEYESMQPFDQGDTTILVLRNPRLRAGSRQLFADWTLFWVDRNEWRKSGRRTISEAVEGTDLRVREADQDPARTPRSVPQPRSPPSALNLTDVLFDIQSSPILRVLSEVYIEGNIEIFDEGEREARASAIYLDIRTTQGWIQDADVRIDVGIRGLPQRIRARAQWMRISPEPALRAEKAEITACEFDKPHYVVETSDLRIRPKSNVTDQRVAYDVSARGNSIRFENGLRLPLPALVYETDEQGNPLVDRFVLGNSAKYGAAIRATVNAELGPVGRATGKALSRVLRFPEVDLRGNWHYDIGILGSRGILFGPGLELRAGDKFKIDMELAIIPDSGNDKGLVRVDKDDRSLLRTWFHARSRYAVREGEWFDLAISTQSDAGVQSEFFERDYLRYEEKDTYLHWRKAREEWYFNASVKTILDDRSDVEELPSVGVYRGRTRVGEAFDNPLYYTGRLDTGFFRRREGDPRYYAPYEDGLGDRDVLRADTDHRLELPFGVGALGARATPYISARATVWNEGADPAESPVRAALIAGIEATTTFWKRHSNGSIHTLTPTIGVRQDIVSEERGGDPVPIDTTEVPIDGRFVELGLRSRWWIPDTQEHFDLDVRALYGSDLPDDEPSGLQPIAVLADFLTYFKKTPVGIRHDGRYDVRSNQTVYSLTSIGFEPWSNVGIEFGYQRGLSTDQSTRLFELASIAGRWRATSKWEIEAGQSYAIAEGTGTGSFLSLRRLGHDFVTEIEVGHRSSEGSSFSIGFEPRLSWKRSRLGLIDESLGVYH